MKEEGTSEVDSRYWNKIVDADAFVLFGFVLVRARILNKKSRNQKKPVTRHKPIAPGVLAKDLKAITSVVLRF